MTDVNQLITDHLDIWTAATERKSSAGRGNGGAVSLHGINKLRELIFQLAVRGKLVVQDKKDQSVEGLLREIAQLRTQVLKDQKAVGKWSAASKFEEPKRPPPDGWKWVPLADVLDWHVGGGTPSKTRQEYWNGGIPWASVKDVGHEKFLHETVDQISAEGLKNSSSNLVPKGCLLIITRMGLGRLSINEIDVAINQDIRALSVSCLMSLEYCYLFFKTLKMEGAGLTVKGVKVGDLLSSPFPLPPLAEQRRIVAKVDELMGLCDALERQAEDSLKAHQTLVETCLATLTNSQSSEDLTQNWTRIEVHFDTLFTTEESVEALRRAVLDLALRGLLTDQSEDAAPASVLLSELYAKNKKSASSRHRTIVSKIKEVEPPFDLPESWAWSNLGLLSSDLRYGTSKKCDRDDKLVPVLRIPNVSGGRVDLDDMKFGPLDPKEVADLRLRTNDLLIIRSNGSLDIVGSFAVVPELEGDFAFAGYLVRVRIDPAYVDPRYIWYVSRSRFLRDQIEGPIRHGVGLKNVNSTELASLQFPIPPREEQERILDKLDDLFELCDRLAQRVDDSNTINFALADTLTSKIH